MTTTELRMTNPAFVLPDGFKGIGHLLSASAQGGVDKSTLELVGMRVSQINGCSACVQGHYEELVKAGETPERIAGVGAWHDAPWYADDERAALALAEAMTRIADRSGDAVSDELWREVIKYYDEKQVSALILSVATTNLFNRINTTVQEQADRPSWKS